MSGARTFRVTAGGGRADYAVHVGRGLLDDLGPRLREEVGAHSYAVISDETVAELYGERVLDGLARAGLRAELLTFPAGEAHKTRAWWGRLTDELLAAGTGRDGAVVALGGGVTGDLAGFVAATFMRGIPAVQVPTSLVAMIDASVGGKTGVDVAAGKNLVGAFHPPAFVLADPEVVETLPRVERAQGLAEAVKHGAILDRAYLEALEEDAADLLDGDPEAVEVAVVRSVELKARVVSADEREGGLRQILNFGHTLGHALEAARDFSTPHGSAVAVGMVLEARLGQDLGITAPGTERRLADVLRRFELPTAPPGDLSTERVLEFVLADKKGRGGRPRYVFLEEPGRVAREQGRGWSRPVPEDRVQAVLTEALEAASREGGDGEERASGGGKTPR